MLKLTTSLLALLWSGNLLAQVSLPATMNDAFRQAGVPPTALTMIVMPAGSQQAVLNQNAELNASPASTMKLLTTMAALEELGPAFRWKTRLYASETAKKEVLKGDLYLRGGGDPDLNLEQFTAMLRELRHQGIRQLRGNLVLDRSYFQPERPDTSLPPFDETPDAYYNVVPDPLLINSNITSFTIDSTGGPHIELGLRTPAEQIRLSNHLRLNRLPCAAWEKEWLPPQIHKGQKQTTEILLSGAFPANCKVTANLNLLDRNLYIGELFRSVWHQLGGSWQGEVVDGHTPDNAKLISEHYSATLADIIRIVNKHSDNGMARMLFLTLGAESSAAGDTTTTDAASQRVRAWLNRHQIDDHGLVIDNGSGLSRSERISAAQLADVLSAGWHSNWNAEFLSSLPVVAVDGTMRKRLKDSQADSRARIKTGTLRNAVAIAGYVKDPQDRTWIVAAIINDERAPKARPALDALIDWIAAGGVSAAMEH